MSTMSMSTQCVGWFLCLIVTNIQQKKHVPSTDWLKWFLSMQGTLGSHWYKSHSTALHAEGGKIRPGMYQPPVFGRCLSKTKIPAQEWVLCVSTGRVYFYSMNYEALSVRHIMNNVTNFILGVVAVCGYISPRFLPNWRDLLGTDWCMWICEAFSKILKAIGLDSVLLKTIFMQTQLVTFVVTPICFSIHP